MNIYVISAAGAVFVAAGVFLGKSLETNAAQGAPEVFAKPCEQSLATAAQWAVGEAERLGKDVSLARRFVLNFKIPSICACAHDRLQSDIDSKKWPLAGELTGMQYKMMLATRGKDEQVRQRAREKLQRELRELTAGHDVSLAEAGQMYRKVDTALKSCFQKLVVRGG
jgi:hypothetical protein